jgi:hypothetical protein
MLFAVFVTDMGFERFQTPIHETPEDKNVERTKELQKMAQEWFDDE